MINEAFLYFQRLDFDHIVKDIVYFQQITQIFYKKNNMSFILLKIIAIRITHHSYQPQQQSQHYKSLSKKMCRNICYFMVTTIVLYYIGFDFILDSFANIVSYIPLLHWPLGIIIDFMKSILHFVPFYYIYVILICIINVFYQLVMTQLTFRNRPAQKQLWEIFFVIFVSLLAPTLVGMILVNWDIVFSILLPLNLAMTAHYVGGNGRVNQYHALRNFIIFIILVPLVRMPSYLLGEKAVEKAVQVAN